MPSAATDDGIRLPCEETGSGTPVIVVHAFAGCARGVPPSDVPEEMAA